MGLTFFMTSHRLRFSQVEGRVGPQPQGTNRIRTPRRGARTSSQPAEEDLPEFGLLRLSDPREDRLKDVLLLGALVLVARRHRVIVGEPLEGRLLHEDGLALAPDLRPDPGDLSAFINEERRPLDPEILATVQVFLLPDPVGLGHPAFVVAEQREVEIVLLSELDVACRVISTYAEDNRAFRGDAAEV